MEQKTVTLPTWMPPAVPPGTNYGTTRDDKDSTTTTPGPQHTSHHNPIYDREPVGYTTGPARSPMKLQRPGHVTGHLDGNPTEQWLPATLSIIDNFVTYAPMHNFTAMQSFFCKHVMVHWSSAEIEGRGQSRRLLCNHPLVVLEHPSWQRPNLMDIVSIL